MSYTLKFTKVALKDIESLKKSGNKATLKKLEILLNELTEHPESGTGQPEELKHNYSGYWSRRINSKDRLIYKINQEDIEVIIVQAKGHY